MGQLRMRREGLEGLPECRLKEGFRFADGSILTAADYSAVIGESFGGEGHDFTREVVRHFGYWEGATTLVYHGATPVATATAICGTPEAAREGYLHMVGALPSYKGSGLGYQVCLNCLHKMQKKGMQNCLLDTDDFRLPAICVYLKLGFRPVMVDAEHEARWAEVFGRIQGV